MVRSLKYMVLLLLVPVCSSIAEAQIGVSVHDTSGIARSSLDIPIFVDSSLSGLGVTAYQMQISYDNNYLEIDSIIAAGSMSASWGLSYNTLKSGALTIAAAGETPLSGTGMLVFIRCTLKNPTWYWYTIISFSKVVFNEGSPAAIFKNGNISIIAPPSISISPNSGLLTAGDNLQFSVSGGISPFQWLVTDSNVASIDTNGFLTAKHGGFAKVIVRDSAGTVDTIDGVVEIRAYRLSVPDTSYVQGQVFDLPVYTTDVTGLNVTSGSFTLQFDQNLLTPMEVIKSGTIVASCEVVSNVSISGRVDVSFASNTSLNGSGIFLYVKFKVSASHTGGTMISPNNILLNESMVGNAVNGYFQTINLTGLNISPSSATLISGDTLRFEVTGGTSPYLWETSDLSVAVIDNTGLLTAIKGGTITVHAQDLYGVTATSGNIDIYDTRITLPDTLCPLGDSVEVPIYISSMKSGAHILSLQATIAYDTSVIKVKEIITAGTLTGGWSYSSNSTGTKVIFATASSNSFMGPGIICRIHFESSLSAYVGRGSALTIQQFLFNEGNPRPLLADGSITITSPLPPILTSPGNGTSKVPTNPILIWNGSTLARTYRIQVSTDSTFTTIIIDSSGVTSTSLKFSKLAHLSKYYWRVNVTIAGVTSEWSSIWNFITTSPPRISISPQIVDFGNVIVGMKKNTTVTLKNIGGDTLFITNITSSNSVFGLKNIASLIAPSDFIVDTLSFSPITVTNYTGKIIIVSNSVNNSDTLIVGGNGMRSMGVTELTGLPKVYSLMDNFPNPFNPSTTIRYGVPYRSTIHIVVFNIIGEQIATLENNLREPGYYTITWRPMVASGVYYYHIDANAVDGTNNKFTDTKKMILLR